MPVGSFSLTYHFANELQRHRPKSVLDLGIGFGLQGALVRQYLDDGVRPWKTKLIGVEAFREYENPVWDLYTGIYYMTIQEYLAGKSILQDSDLNFDFIILSDVIEHLEKEEGRNIIYKLMDLLNKGGVLMIGTPGVWCEQGAVHGNEYEEHKSLWKWNEFPPGFEVIKDGKGDEFGHYMILVKYVKK